VAPAKRTKLGMALEQSAKEILAHIKDELRLPVWRIVLPDVVDVKSIRIKAGMSQSEFSRAFVLIRERYKSGSKVEESLTQPPAPSSR
jgi:hypothetical protein